MRQMVLQFERAIGALKRVDSIARPIRWSINLDKLINEGDDVIDVLWPYVTRFTYKDSVSRVVIESPLYVLNSCLKLLNRKSSPEF